MAASVTGPLFWRKARSIIAVTAKRPLVVRRIVRSLLLAWLPYSGNARCPRPSPPMHRLLAGPLPATFAGCLFNSLGFLTVSVKYTRKPSAQLGYSGLSAVQQGRRQVGPSGLS